MSNNPNDKRTASQRIDDLERGIMSMYQAFDAVTRDLGTAQQAIRVLGNKVEAMAQLSLRGEKLTDEALSKQMIENNVAELKSKVEELVTRGTLVTSEVIEDGSFVVGSEVDESGAAVNPRLQFALSALSPELQEKLKGHKAGDVVTVQDGKLKLQVLEVYAIQSPAPAAQEAPASEEAPSAEQATGTESAKAE